METNHVVCSSCAAENLEDALRCLSCESPLDTVRCRRCGASNPPQQKFCGECAWPSSTALTAPEAERRQITVLFCDLVGSTALSRELDPEDFREVIRAYQTTCAEIVGQFDGHVAQFLGDGVLVYFGYPRAHEDDARRAVRAGLEFITALGALRTKDHTVRVRVGIHTGLVVVGEIGPDNHRTHLAIGETPNFAFHVQELANPGTVFITEATHRLVRGFFTCEDLGEKVLRGAAHSIKVHRVLNESGARGRMDVAATTGFTPYVGRKDEIATLIATWKTVTEGAGRVIAIRGEAGIGKSRLLEILKARLDSEQNPIAQCQCSPYFKNRALYPVVDLLERLLGLKGNSPLDVKLTRLEDSVSMSGLHAPHAVPLLAGLLSLPLPGDGRYLELQMTPERQRQRTLEVLVQWLTAVAAQRPMLMVFEDLHWADPSTLEFVRLLVEKEPPRALLCLLTYRTEFSPTWAPGHHPTELELRPLPPDESETMATCVADMKALPDEVVALLVAKTGGIPLYIEEVTKAILETGQLREMEDRYELVGPLPSEMIPASVQDSLMARLDRLGRSKPLAQLAATLGRDFRYEVLQAVSQKNDHSLQADLARLIDAELVYQTGTPPQATYFFKHALIRDAAYESLLRKTRQQYHREIAETLLARFSGIANEQPDLMAIHFEGADMRAEAVAEWHKAGVQALARAANQEASAHLQRALVLLASLPETVARMRLELELQLALAPAQMAIRGWASNEVEVACTRARDLCLILGATDRLLHALWGLWTNHFLRGDMNAAMVVAQQVLAMALGSQSPMLQVMAHHAAGFTLFFRGEFGDARKHAEAGIALFDPAQEAVIVGTLQFSSTVALRVFLSISLWMLGARREADAQMEEAIALARRLDHAPSLAFGLSFRIYLYFYRREPEQARVVAEELLALSNEEGFLLWIPVAMMYRGWSRSALGEAADGVDEMKRGMDLFLATGTSLTRVQVLAAQAESVRRTGDRSQTLALIDEGIREAARRKEHLYEPELHRLQGEILMDPELGTPALVAAEQALRQALAVARHQGAVALEVLATVSLCRLLRKNGSESEATSLEAAMTGRFQHGAGASAGGQPLTDR